MPPTTELHNATTEQQRRMVSQRQTAAEIDHLQSRSPISSVSFPCGLRVDPELKEVSDKAERNDSNGFAGRADDTG